MRAAAVAGLLAFGLVLGVAGSVRAQQPTTYSCSINAAHTHGCALTYLQGPSMVGEEGVRAVKRGRACAWNFLALVAIGDMRVSTAMRDGGITRVATVDYESIEAVPYYLGISRYCTIVRGE